MKGVVRAILIGGALALSWQVASAAPWSLTGKVIHVDDGDSLTILQADFSKTTVRLSDIDAPERGHRGDRPGQPFSQAAKQSLVSLARGQSATATCYETDHWGRSVCTVFVGGLDVNAEQLRRGMAWVNRLNRSYVRNPQSVTFEAQARAAGLGIWAAGGAQPVPPWEWRKQCWKNQACDGAGQ